MSDGIPTVYRQTEQWLERPRQLAPCVQAAAPWGQRRKLTTGGRIIMPTTGAGSSSTTTAPAAVGHATVTTSETDPATLLREPAAAVERWQVAGAANTQWLSRPGGRSLQKRIIQVP